MAKFTAFDRSIRRGPRRCHRELRPTDAAGSRGELSRCVAWRRIAMPSAPVDRDRMRAVAVCLLIACRPPAPHAPSSDESALRAAHEAILAHHRARDWKAMEGSGVVLDIGNGGIHRITPES